MYQNRLIALLSLASFGVCATPDTAYAQSGDTDRVVRLIQQRCVKCHGGEVVNAGIDFSDLNDEMEVWRHRLTFTKALDMLSSGTMPPETEPKMPDGMRSLLTGWLEHTLNNVDVSRIPHDPGFVPPRRLNRNEYVYTVQDIFGLDSLPEDLLPVDLVIGDSFDNDTATLTVEPLWFERALAAADESIRAVWSSPEALEALLFVRPDPPLIEEKAIFVTTEEQARSFDLGSGDFAVLARVVGAPGNIFTTAPPGRGFRPGSKQLSITDNSLTYQIERNREISIEDLDIESGQEHWIGLSVDQGRVSLYMNGRLLARVANFGKADVEGYLFKIAQPGSRKQKRKSSSEDSGSSLRELWFFSNSLEQDEMLRRTLGDSEVQLSDATFHWDPTLKTVVPEMVTAQDAATLVLERYLTKAFRRSPTEDEANRYLAMFNEGSDAGIPFDIAMQLPLTAALASPSFFFRSEAAQDTRDVYPISSPDMASRLSYFLWSSTPDSELMSAGISGRLLEEDELLRQIKRMLADEKADRFFERFVVQWLRTEGLGDTIRPDGDKFPEVSDSLMAAMRLEGVKVFGDVIRDGRSLLKLLDDDSTFMNDELAKHYGYANLEGTDWQKVMLADGSRGGLMTQAASLTVSSSPRRTSPVFRGKWVLDVLLGEPPPPPPPNVPPLSADAESNATSLREILEAHRANPVCATCHDRIDPYGLSLEQYDAVGRLRTEKQDTQTTLLSGETLDGATDLKRFLLEKKSDSFVRHLTKKMLAYSLGRELTFPDERTVQQILKGLEENDYSGETLIRGIVLSEAFRYRKNPVAVDATEVGDD